MGLFKKDYCIVLFGNLKGYPHSITAAEKDRYYNQARRCVYDSFGHIDYQVEVLDYTDHCRQTLNDIKDNGLMTPAKKAENAEDKKELADLIRATLMFLGYGIDEVKQYQVYFDLIEGQFMLLCKVKR